MAEGSNPRDLEDRTFLFAQSIRAFVKTLPRTVSNAKDIRQLVRASGSVAANWSEADEALSRKDFLMRAKICRKEAKESRLFLRLVDVSNENAKGRNALAAEARELTLVFSAIIKKSSGDQVALANWKLKLSTLEFTWDLGFDSWDLPPPAAFGLCNLKLAATCGGTCL